MFKYLKNFEINKFKNHQWSYRKYWFKFMDSKIKCNIWWYGPLKRSLHDIFSLVHGLFLLIRTVVSSRVLTFFYADVMPRYEVLPFYTVILWYRYFNLCMLMLIWASSCIYVQLYSELFALLLKGFSFYFMIFSFSFWSSYACVIGLFLTHCGHPRWYMNVVLAA